MLPYVVLCCVCKIAIDCNILPCITSSCIVIRYIYLVICYVIICCVACLVLCYAVLHYLTTSRIKLHYLT